MANGEWREKTLYIDPKENGGLRPVLIGLECNATKQEGVETAMATIPQRELFTLKEIENLGDLDRLKLVLEYLPDEALMVRLKSDRGKGRDDWPVRAVWNSVLAGVVYQHASIESLRRELARNLQLRWLCGFDVTRPEKLVPPSSTYTRLFKKLMAMPEVIDAMFDSLVDSLRRELPGKTKNAYAHGVGHACDALYGAWAC